MEYDMTFVREIAAAYANMEDPTNIASDHGIEVDELYQILKDNREIVEAACNDWEEQRPKAPTRGGLPGAGLSGIERALDRIATALERIANK